MTSWADQKWQQRQADWVLFPWKRADIRWIHPLSWHVVHGILAPESYFVYSGLFNASQPDERGILRIEWFFWLVNFEVHCCSGYETLICQLEDTNEIESLFFLFVWLKAYSLHNIGCIRVCCLLCSVRLSHLSKGRPRTDLSWILIESMNLLVIM